MFALVKFIKSHHGAEGVDSFSVALESGQEPVGCEATPV